MTENENKSFTDISSFSKITVADDGICDHDLRKEMKITV